MNIVARMVSLSLLAMLCAGAALGQEPGDIRANPLPSFVASSLDQSIRSQIVAPAKAQIRVLVHFPGGAGENGRICGEVIEAPPEGERVRTFVSTYTRAGRVLTRFEDGPFREFVARDSVFRNCSPRL